MNSIFNLKYLHYTTKSYFILEGKYNIKIFTLYYKAFFNDPTVKHICTYSEIAYVKNRKKKTFRYYVTEQKFSTVINEKSQFNGYFSSDFNDFLQLHSLTLYEYNE